ncbi:hypothetical protein PV11_00730 [Exophiala sideris]|uniref:Uncharacterized protein n=1 Tax=Exophiala sideris TaxID=1016849 RepID=A0A0D1YQI0_9EURO|nr:hypothetical protein PV11_00730 [Exophiala sideris]
MPITAPRDRYDFKVALICALPLEAECLQAVFDKFWEDDGRKYGKAAGDANVYTTGVIGEHNVVLAHLPGMGTVSAAAVAGALRVSFPNTKLALVVGICGGIPYGENQEEIVLGDVIISQALVQYDFGRQYPGGFKRKTGVRDTLGRLSPEIQGNLAKLETRRYKQRIRNNIATFLQDIQRKLPGTNHPGLANDVLYNSSYVHRHYPPTICDECGKDDEICEVALKTECEQLGCESSMRSTRTNSTSSTKERPVAHFGIMGSGNTVMKSGQHRDRMAQADEIIGFEMEGAGVWDYLPSIVVKGVCDYADSHKRKGWQHYAAATAAACTKALLVEWSVEDTPTGSDASLNPVWHVPFDQIPGFVGRTDELKRLQERTFDPEGRRIVALLGLGGIGKSRLALELLFRVKSEHSDYSVFWIQASDQLTLEKDVREIGKKLEIPGIENDQADVKTLVKQRLSSSAAGRWLLILDNADDEALWVNKANSEGRRSTLMDWFPSTAHGAILITTRSRRVASYLAGREVIELAAMSAYQARNIFMHTLENPEMAGDQAAVSTLLDKLTFLPLAIVQAASYINMTQETVKTYLELMEEPEEEVIKLLSEDFGDQSRYANAENPVATTWLISFEQIRKNNSIAAQFLSSMACLHEKNIPLSLLPKIDSKKDAVDAMATLRGYSFVTKQTQQSGGDHSDVLYDMHRLVHLAARNWLKMNAMLPDWTTTCIIRMRKLFPKTTHKHKSMWTIYLPHAQRLCRETCVEDLIERLRLLAKMGSSFRDEGKFDESVEAYTAVAKWMERRFGGSHAETMMAYAHLGDALTWQGNISAAEVHLKKAFEWMVDTLGKEASVTLSTMYSLAVLHNQKGEKKEAEKIYREVLQINLMARGKNDGRTVTTMGNLARVLERRGEYLEAEKIQREALHLSETNFGKNHPETLVSILNLASTLKSQGDYLESEQLFRAAINTLETVRGKSHHHTLTGKVQLAELLCRTGNYTEAVNICRDVLDLQEATVGKSHRYTTNTMTCLARVLTEQGNYSEAESICREVVGLRGTTMGKNHPKTIRAVKCLAEILTKQDKDSKAESAQREVLGLQATTFGNQNHHRLSAPSNVTSLLSVQGEPSEAKTTSQSVRN